MRALRDAVTIWLIALVAWPVLSKALELRDLYRSGANLRCLTNLAAAASGLRGGGSLCPAGGRPYRILSGAGAWVFQCDDPGNHLRVPMRFVRTGSVTEARLTLPGFPAAPGVHVLATTKVKTTLRVLKDSVLIHMEKKPWERWFVMPVAAVAGLLAFLISFHFAVDSSSETRRELARSPGACAPSLGALAPGERRPSAPGVAAWAGAAVRGFGRLGLWIMLMAWSAVLLASGLRGAFYTRDVTVLREAGRASFQDYWFGKAWTGPTEIQDVQAVVPVAFGKRHYRVYAIFADQGIVDKRFLFTVGEAEVGAVSLLERPPVFGSP
ncbi:MAG: hypothetical protein HY748_00985 [Elusimicrobia bacterium]|nr:hypothetical protein [Elusimicrobiota bacterium]